MKEKTPVSIFVLLAIVCLGAPGWVVGTETNNLDFPTVLDSIMNWTEARPLENASRLQSLSSIARVDSLDDAPLSASVAAGISVPMLDSIMILWDASDSSVQVLTEAPGPRDLSSAHLLAGRIATPEPPPFRSRSATVMRVASVMFAAALVVFGLVMFGRIKATPPFVPEGLPYALRVSWDFPFRGYKAFPIDHERTAITIGSSKFDTIYSPELVAGHIHIGVGRDVLTLTCYGPIRLGDGTVLDPPEDQSLAETFRNDQKVSFVAGESGFVLERVSKPKEISAKTESFVAFV